MDPIAWIPLLLLIFGCAGTVVFWRTKSNNYELTIKAKNAEIDSKDAEIERLKNESVPETENRVAAFKDAYQTVLTEKNKVEEQLNQMISALEAKRTPPRDDTTLYHHWGPAPRTQLQRDLENLRDSANTFTNVSKQMLRDFLKDAAEHKERDFTNSPFQRKPEEKTDDENEN